jgi:hypothetical protein
MANKSSQEKLIDSLFEDPNVTVVKPVGRKQPAGKRKRVETEEDPQKVIKAIKLQKKKDV